MISSSGSACQKRKAVREQLTSKQQQRDRWQTIAYRHGKPIIFADSTLGRSLTGISSVGSQRFLLIMAKMINSNTEIIDIIVNAGYAPPRPGRQTLILAVIASSRCLNI